VSSARSRFAANRRNIPSRRVLSLW
jgi:hypothetical protein